MPTPVTSAVYFGNVEADPDVALRAEVVDLVRLEFVDQFDQIDRVGQVAVVKEKLHAIDVRILVQVIDAIGVEGARAADDPVDLVTLASKRSAR